ncbi:MAG: hypothetical protein U9O63_08415 [Actinomycetota bacterium]|nr:hypothetical protein [Actinomycetota bacterium]
MPGPVSCRKTLGVIQVTTGVDYQGSTAPACVHQVSLHVDRHSAVSSSMLSTSCREPAFSRWMQANHPEVAIDTMFFPGDTVEESVARGELRARYAKEWAAHLDASNCTYEDYGC